MNDMKQTIDTINSLERDKLFTTIDAAITTDNNILLPLLLSGIENVNLDIVSHIAGKHNLLLDNVLEDHRDQIGNALLDNIRYHDVVTIAAILGYNSIVQNNCAKEYDNRTAFCALHYKKYDIATHLIDHLNADVHYLACYFIKETRNKEAVDWLLKNYPYLLDKKYLESFALSIVKYDTFFTAERIAEINFDKVQYDTNTINEICDLKDKATIEARLKALNLNLSTTASFLKYAISKGNEHVVAFLCDTHTLSIQRILNHDSVCIELDEHLKSSKSQFPESSIKIAMMLGRTEFIKANKTRLGNYDVTPEAVIALYLSHFDTVRYLIDNNQVNVQEVAEYFTEQGNDVVVKWLLRNYKDQIDIEKLKSKVKSDIGCLNAYLNSPEWLLDSKNSNIKNITKAINSICRVRDESISEKVNKLVEAYGEQSVRLLIVEAIAEGNEKMVFHLSTTYFDTVDEWIKGASTYISQIISANNTPKSYKDGYISIQAMFGTFNVGDAKYIEDVEQTLKYALTFNYTPLVEYLILGPYNKRLVFTNVSIHFAKLGNYEMVKWLKENYKNDIDIDALDKAISEGEGQPISQSTGSAPSTPSVNIIDDEIVSNELPHLTPQQQSSTTQHTQPQILKINGIAEDIIEDKKDEDVKAQLSQSLNNHKPDLASHNRNKLSVGMLIIPIAGGIIAGLACSCLSTNFVIIASATITITIATAVIYYLYRKVTASRAQNAASQIFD